MPPISNTKFVNLAIVLSSLIKKIFYKVLNLLIPFINLVIVFESINSSLNLELLYYKLVNIIKP